MGSLGHLEEKSDAWEVDIGLVITGKDDKRHSCFLITFRVLLLFALS